MTIDEMPSELNANVASLTVQLRRNWQGRCMLWLLRRFGWPKETA